MPKKGTVFLVLSIACSIAILLVLIGLFVYPGWVKIQRAADDDADDDTEQPTGPTDTDFLQKIADEDVDTIAQVAEAVKRSEDARKVLEGQELINYKLLCAPSADEKSGKQPMCTRALRANMSSTGNIAGCWADCMADYWESCNRKDGDAKKACLWNIYGAVARNETGAQTGLVTLETEPRQTQVGSVAKYFVDTVKTGENIDAAAFGNLKFRTKAPFVTPKQVWDATRPSLGLKPCPSYNATQERFVRGFNPLVDCSGGALTALFDQSNCKNRDGLRVGYTISTVHGVIPDDDTCFLDVSTDSQRKRCGEFPAYKTLSKVPWSDSENYSSRCSDDVINDITFRIS